MVKLSTKTLYSILSLFLLFVITATAQGGGNGGVKKPVWHVTSNVQVQALGKFCVEEHNKQILWQHQGKPALVFSQVVKAETEDVNNGIKYYLKISTTTVHGGGKYNRGGGYYN